MVMCAVFGCNNNNNKKLKNAANNTNFISFYSFPKNELLCKEWIKNCWRSHKFIAKNARICSLHFNADDFERNLMNELLKIESAPKKLKEGAVPTANLFKDGNEKENKMDESCSNRYKRIAYRENKLMIAKLLKPNKVIPVPGLLSSEFLDITEIPFEGSNQENTSLKQERNMHKELKIENDKLKLENQKLKSENNVLREEIRKMKAKISSELFKI